MATIQNEKFTLGIVNNDGSPKVGSLVELKAGASTYAMTELGSGKYSIDSIPTGKYDVWVDSVFTNETTAVGEGQVSALGNELDAILVGTADNWTLNTPEELKQLLNLDQVNNFGIPDPAGQDGTFLGVDSGVYTLLSLAGTTFERVFEVKDGPTLKEALEAPLESKMILAVNGLAEISFTEDTTIEVYGRTEIFGDLFTISTGTFRLTLNGAVGSPVPEALFFRTTTFQLEATSELESTISQFKVRNLGTGGTYFGNFFFENSPNGLPTSGSGSLVQEFWDNTNRSQIDENIQSTGIKSGAVLSVNGGDNTKFDLTAGEAYLMNYSDQTNIVSKKLSWTDQTALSVSNLLTDVRTNVAITDDNSLVIPDVVYNNSFSGFVDGVSTTLYLAEKSSGNFDSEELRLFAGIGRIVHSNQTNISFVVQLQQHTEAILSSYLDFINLFPAINVEGNEFSGVAGTLSVQKTEGKGFRFGSNYVANIKDPNIQLIPAKNPTDHFYRWQNGAGGFNQSATTTFLDPANYDNGSGTLQGVNNNQWTIQPVWVFAGSGTMFVQYGQEVFSSKESAINALATFNPVLDQNLVEDAVFRGYFIIRGGATDTTDAGSFEWRPPLSERGGGVGTSVVVDLQTAYEASFDPEITTDSSRGALTLKQGSGLDSDNVVEVQNGAGTETFSVDGSGNVTSNNLVDKFTTQEITGNKAFDGSTLSFINGGTLDFWFGVATQLAIFKTIAGVFQLKAVTGDLELDSDTKEGFLKNKWTWLNDLYFATPTDNGATYTNKKMIVRDDTTGKVEIATIPSGTGDPIPDPIVDGAFIVKNSDGSYSLLDGDVNPPFRYTAGQIQFLGAPPILKGGLKLFVEDSTGVLSAEIYGTNVSTTPYLNIKQALAGGIIDIGANNGTQTRLSDPTIDAPNLTDIGSVYGSNKMVVSDPTNNGRLSIATIPSGGGSLSNVTISNFPLASINQSTTGADTVYLSKFVPEFDISVAQIGYFATSVASENVRVGIYDSSFNLIDSTTINPNTGGANSLKKATSTGVTLTGGTEYWLGIKSETGASSYGTQTTLTNAGLARSQFFNSAGLPDPFTGSASNISPCIFLFD